jgi:quercetin dioxygenase-like cupin family protein
MLKLHTMSFITLNNLTPKEVVPGYYGRVIHTETMSLMYWMVEKEAIMPIHTHLHEQVAHVIIGRFELTVDGETRVMEPGMVAVIPPHAPHGGKAITYCELMDVFYPVREDYKFEEMNKSTS